MEYSDIWDDLGEWSSLLKEKQVDRMILAGLKNICQKTWVYTEVIPILTTAGEPSYTLSPTETSVQVCGIWEAQRVTLNTPQPSASTSASGGTLGAATYSYKVTAIADDYAESLPCAAVTQATSGSTSTVTLTWSAIAGASGYRVYGRTDSSWLQMTETTSLTYTDDGSDTPSGAVSETTETVEQIELTNRIDMNDTNRNWRSSENDYASRVIYDGYSDIRLSDIPVTSGIGYQVRAALFPTAQATIPSILEQYKDVIQDYIKWKAYMYPKTEKMPWADARKAQDYKRDFVRNRANIKSNAMRAFGGSQRIETVYFASGNNRRLRGTHAF